MEKYEVHVESLCRDQYLRNNKRGGLKNLRCFPECLPTGHHAKGFCGHRITVTTYSKDFLAKNAVVLGRFSTRDDPLPEPTNLSLVLSSRYLGSNIMSRIRDREDPLKEFISSQRINEEKMSGTHRVKTIFYFTPTSWHYGWRSSKHKKDQSHTFRVYLFVPVEGNTYYQLVALSKTSDFTLSSSKRAKEGQEPVQQHLSVTQQDIEEFIKASQSSRENKRRKKSNNNDDASNKKRKKSPKSSSLNKNKKNKNRNITTTTTNTLPSYDMDHRIFGDSDSDGDLLSSRALLGTFLGWAPDSSVSEPWVPLSQRDDKNAARRQALQRLLVAVTNLDDKDNQSGVTNINNFTDGASESDQRTGEDFLHGLLKGEFLDISPFGTNDSDDILSFEDVKNHNEGKNEASILKGLASYMIDSNEMTAAISNFLHQNRADIEKNQNMERVYDDMLELCEKLIDEFLLRHGSSISHVLEIVQAKKNITKDLESKEGRKLTKQDLGLWILSACAPPISSEVQGGGGGGGSSSSSSSSSNSKSENLMFISSDLAAFVSLNGVYDWHALIDGDREDYFLKCGVPWLARKLMKHMFSQLKVNVVLNGPNNPPSIELQVKSRLGINSSLTFIGDGKIHLWPIQGGALFGLLESPNFGGEYVCNIFPGKKTAEIRHILKTKDETTITAWYEDNDDLHITLNYYNLIKNKETGTTKLVKDENARVHEVYCRNTAS